MSWSRGRSVSIESRVRARRSGFNSRCGNDEIFFLLYRVQTGSGAHPASYTVSTGSYFPVDTVAGCEANHSIPSSAEVKNAWSHTSTPSMSHHGVVVS
jgi:hypothetical protein